MSYLSGINDCSHLGTLSPYLSSHIKENKNTVECILKQADELSGLGDTQGEVLSFDDVVVRYNKGISKEEITAWVWYKRRMGVPMNGWDNYYINEKGKALEEKLFELVQLGALFYLSGELLPFPMYAFGNKDLAGGASVHYNIHPGKIFQTIRVPRPRTCSR